MICSSSVGYDCLLRRRYVRQLSRKLLASSRLPSKSLGARILRSLTLFWISVIVVSSPSSDSSDGGGVGSRGGVGSLGTTGVGVGSWGSVTVCCAGVWGKGVWVRETVLEVGAEGCGGAGRVGTGIATLGPGV